MSSQQKMCTICGALNGSLPYHYHSKHNYCDPCKETFTDRTGVINHLVQEHHKKLKCDFCHVQTLTEAILEQHIIRKHQSTAASKSLKKFQCELCPFVAKYINILQKHVETKHARRSSIPTYRCHLCRYVTREKAGLQKHLKLEHKSSKMPPNPQEAELDDFDDIDEDDDKKSLGKSVGSDTNGGPSPAKKAKTEFIPAPAEKELPSPNEVCMVCHAKIKDEVHYQIEHQGCFPCQKTFRSVNDIIEHHAIIHLKKTIFQCNMCDYYGFTMRGVQEHRNLSHNSVKYMCGDCGVIFDSEVILLAHAADIHGDNNDCAFKVKVKEES